LRGFCCGKVLGRGTEKKKGTEGRGLGETGGMGLNPGWVRAKMGAGNREEGGGGGKIHRSLTTWWRKNVKTPPLGEEVL